MIPSILLIPILIVISLIPPAHAADRSSCTPGTFFTASRCQRCPSGTYQPMPASTSCIPCPQGTFNIFRGAQGLDLCEPCPPNTFNNRTGATAPSQCTRCPSGTVSVSGSATCVTCPAGTFITLQDGSVESFARGFNFCPDRNPSCYPANFPRRTRCRPCPVLSFSDTPNSRACTPCPFAVIGSSSCGGCSRPGIECVIGRRERECRNFRFNAGNVTNVCANCPAGQIGNQRIAASQCVQCPSGTFKGPFESRCMPCRGENAIAPDQSSCLPAIPRTACPSNFLRTAQGTCIQCRRWERANVRRGICQICPANRQSNGGVDRRCRPCPVGMVRASGAETTCVCRPGWVIDSDGERCTPCPAGTFTVDGVQCFPCARGTFSQAGSVECRRCRFNFVAPERGQARCDRCSRGMVPNPIRGCVSSRTNCGAGEIRVLDANNILAGCSVTSCPEGTFLSNGSIEGISRTSCSSCTIRSRFDPDLERCLSCPRGQFSEGGVSTECVPVVCENGFRLNQETGECTCSRVRTVVNGTCVECGAGTSGSAENRCLPCPVGTFNIRVGTCFPCPVNTFADEEGLTECKPCPEGTFTAYRGSANCVVRGGLA